MSGLDSENRAQKQTMLERSVMGCVIMGDMLPSHTGLDSVHFQDPFCRRLFEAVCAMEKERKPISLEHVIMGDDSLEASAVVDLVQERCVSVVICEQHCALMRDAHIRRMLERMLITAMEELAEGRDVAETTDALRGKLDSILTAAQSACTGHLMLELICDIIMQIEKHIDPPAPPIACGIEKIDECLNGGFRAGDLAVVAALTSVGKSAMLAFMMRNAAEQGKKILLISCEMSDEQNAERYLASISGVDLGRIMRREPFTDDEYRRFNDGLELYRPDNIRVISSGSQTVESVRREAIRMKAKEGLDMIVVDYLQRMCVQRGRHSRADEVGSVAAGLKSMAVDLNVPVLTAAQFNREAAKGRNEYLGREDAGIPALHQLRDSSQIEDEANTVIILDEPRRAPGDGVRSLNALVVKNRSGATKATPLLFDPKTMRFAQGKI